jgi:hypothetical protein
VGCVGKVCSSPPVCNYCKISFLNEMTRNSHALFKIKKNLLHFQILLLIVFNIVRSVQLFSLVHNNSTKDVLIFVPDLF